MIFPSKSNTARGHFLSLRWMLRQKFKPLKARIKWSFISRETQEFNMAKLVTAGSSSLLRALNLPDGTVSPEEQMRLSNKSTGCIARHLGQWCRFGAYDP